MYYKAIANWLALGQIFQIWTPQIVPRTRDPWWDEYYLLDVCHHGDTLDLQVMGEKGDETTDLGVLNIPLEVHMLTNIVRICPNLFSNLNKSFLLFELLFQVQHFHSKNSLPSN